MEVKVFDSKEDLYTNLAQIFIEEIKNNPRAKLGLATGETTILLYKKLIEDHIKNKTSYKNVCTFNLDEYVGLNGDHPQSYRSFMNKELFSGIDIDLSNTYLPRGNSEDLNNEINYYDDLLENNELDIQLLGIGENAHIAFNEPGTSFDSKTNVVTLTEETRIVNGRFFDSLDEVPTKAITMGIGSIMDAKKIILVATGNNKASAIKATIQGSVTEEVPSSILQKHSNVIVYLDKDAASLIE